MGWNVSMLQRFSLGAWKYNVHVPEGKGESKSGVDILVGWFYLALPRNFKPLGRARRPIRPF
jgi:hypothetical protein